MRNLTFQNVLRELFSIIPELKDSEDFQAIASHGNADNQYVVFGVFENFYIESFKKGNVRLINRMSQFLEKVASSKEIALQELVANGFLENLDKKAAYYEGIVKTFKKNMKKFLEDMNKFRSDYKKKHRPQINSTKKDRRYN